MGADGAGQDGDNPQLRRRVFQVPQGISADPARVGAPAVTPGGDTLDQLALRAYPEVGATATPVGWTTMARKRAMVERVAGAAAEAAGTNGVHYVIVHEVPDG